MFGMRLELSLQQSRLLTLDLKGLQLQSLLHFLVGFYIAVGIKSVSCILLLSKLTLRNGFWTYYR